MKLGSFKSKVALGQTSVNTFYKGNRKVGDLYPLLEPVGDWATSSLSATVYEPLLIGPVFNVVNFGADSSGRINSRQAFLDAIDAVNAQGGGTVYIPEGVYTLFPLVEGEPTIQIPNNSVNLRIEGDGPTKTILNFRAWGGQDPAGLILARGNGFQIGYNSTGITGFTLRGFRATGNAPVTSDAGLWLGNSSLTGWDINHKGIGIWGEITGTVIEDCEWDNWRGETLYSGGGTELGTFTINRCVVRNCNGSAISMGGEITIDTCEIYAVLNGTECFTFGGQQLTIRDCIVEPFRNVETVGGNIGGFGLINHGLETSSMLIEGCTLRKAKNAEIFLAEFAHNVVIQNNYFEDFQTAIYAIYLGQYVGQPGIGNEQQGRFENISILNNTFHANENVGNHVILSYTSPWLNMLVDGNTCTTALSKTATTFISNGGFAGTSIISDNLILCDNPLDAAGMRPLWINNTIIGPQAEGKEIWSYLPGSDPTPFYLEPTFGSLRVVETGSSFSSRLAVFTSGMLDLLPTGYEFYLRRTGSNSIYSGAEIKPDASWNTLSRGYMIFEGAVLKMVKNADGKMDFSSWTPNTVFIPDLYHPGWGGTSDIALRGQLSANLIPNEPFTFITFSGIAVGETVTLNYNSNVTITHTPGVIEMWNGEDFVASGSGSLTAIRVGNVLIIQNPDASLYSNELGDSWQDENSNYLQS